MLSFTGKVSYVDVFVVVRFKSPPFFSRTQTTYHFVTEKTADGNFVWEQKS